MTISYASVRFILKSTKTTRMKPTEFTVPGVPPDQTWRLFNTSNYSYYKRTVNSLKRGVCDFCNPPDKQRVILENDSWYVMINDVAPRGGTRNQDYQFVIPHRRHVETVTSLAREDWMFLGEIVDKIHLLYQLDGCVLVARSGNPKRNAKSMPHLHFNLHVPTGLTRVTVTIAKSEDDRCRRLPILVIFEKMRCLEEQGIGNPFLHLTDEEKSLVQDKLSPL